MPLFFEAWYFLSDTSLVQVRFCQRAVYPLHTPSLTLHHLQTPALTAELYISLGRIGSLSQPITFDNVQIHDIVRLETAICRDVEGHVYFHMTRLDVIARRPL